MYQFEWASQADIVRSLQKDRVYVDRMVKIIEDICVKVRGAHFNASIQQEVVLCANTIYLLFSSVFGDRTLGQEYCELQQVTGSMHQAARILHRFILTILQAMIPYLYSLFYQQDNRGQIGRLVRLMKQYGINPQLAPDILGKLFLLLFYFDGQYYEAAKRIAGVREQHIGSTTNKKPYYGALGFVLAVQLILNFIAVAKKSNSGTDTENERERNGRTPNSQKQTTRPRAPL
eukprot:TRINITY_DN4839_c0_g1_i2.p1 TRINITY_DN4839_c0_g1~~TRINITY_DN4839_c0_g1_i2.p1  ORF type:complete len:232 (+),score=17.31 TRINITY_DN4839_c0_g1_i2:208-903(+)